MTPRQSSEGPLDALARDVARHGVQEACRLHGIHRSTWYRRSRKEREPGTRETARLSLTEEIRSLALEQPAWGCDRIAFYLSFSGVRTSSPTVQKILIGLGLGRKEDRIRAASRSS